MDYRFAHFNFNVLDMQKSLRCYKEALELEPVEEKNAPDGAFRIVYLGDPEKSGFLLELTALRDSGNSLTDPFTGEPVLVAQYDAVKKLLPCALPRPADPAAPMTRLQAQGVGCRLIPYHALGSSGMLLAVRCDRVTVGGKAAGSLVAIAPDRLGSTYQALTGGGQYA